MSHPNAEHVSLATGQWRASSFHNCAVIKAPLNLAPGLSGESSTSTLLAHASPPASAMAQLLPWLPRLIPATLPVVEQSQEHRLSRLPSWAGAWGSMARKRYFSPLLSCQPIAAEVQQLAKVPPANVLKSCTPHTHTEVSLHPHAGALQVLGWSRAVLPQLQFLQLLGRRV